MDHRQLLAQTRTALLRDDLALADDLARQAGPLAEQHGDGDAAADAMGLLATVALTRGDATKARYWWLQALERALVADAWPVALDAQRGLALVDRASGLADHAETRLRTVLADAIQLGLLGHAQACRLDLARWALERLDVATAVDELSVLLADPDVLDPGVRGEAGLVRAQLLVMAGDVDAAVDAVDQAVTWLHTAGHVRCLQAGLQLQAQMWALAGITENTA